MKSASLPPDMQPRPIEPPALTAEPAVRPEGEATNLLEIMDKVDVVNPEKQKQDCTSDTVAPVAREVAPHDIDAREAPRLPADKQKKRVVDCLIASLYIANVGDVAESDTMRHSLESWYSDFFRNNKVDLSMLWNSLLAEEEVSVEQAALPLLVFTETQRNHGYSFTLPDALENFAGKDQLTQLAWRRIRAHGGFARVFTAVSTKKPAPPKSEPAARQRKTGKAEGIFPERNPAETRKRIPASAAKKIVGVLLLLFALGALVFAVMQVLQYFE
jgi:hypothetical protein